MKINLKYFLFTVAILIVTNTFAQVGIGTNTPAASAALEVSSSTNNKGILIPRITATQKDAISNPALGLLIYQSSAPAGFYYYTGAAWKMILSQSDLESKVDKVNGKDLSTNDYTTVEKNKLEAIIGSNTGDQTATTVANVAAGTIAAVTVQGALNELDTEKATLTSPALTGTPTAPTATPGTNTTQLATTAFVTAAAGTVDASPSTKGKIQLAGDLSGTAASPTITNAAVIAKTLTGFTSGAGTVVAGDNILQAVQKLDGNDALKAPLASPNFTGTPVLPTGTTGITQTAADNSTKLATTAYADAAARAAVTGKQNTLTNSAGLAGALSDATGTGLNVFATSPTLVTPVIGAATGTSLSVSGQLTSTIETGTAPLVVSSTTPVANLNIGGNAATATLASTVTTNANLTGDVISSGNNVTTIDAGRVTNSMLAGNIDLTSKVTGILPSSNGGTGNGFTNITGPTTSVKTFTLPDASATILTSNAAVSIAQGGTGQTTYTDGQLLIGNTTGNTLTKATLTPGVGISITNTSGAITIANTSGVSNGTTFGDMNYWNGTAWVRVAAGSDGQVLTFVGNIPRWQKPAFIPSLGPNDVFNPKTGKVWMDRNLGASRVATSRNDAASYGDFYQWGRGADGYPQRVSDTYDGTSIRPTDIASTGAWRGKFIIIAVNTNRNDWVTNQTDNAWNKVTAGVPVKTATDPCPSGYRLPTEEELNAERLSWVSNNADGAFASPLRLPMAGGRNGSNGSIGGIGAGGRYWSSTSKVNGTSSISLDFNSSFADMTSNFRAVGLSVRCLKE